MASETKVSVDDLLFASAWLDEFQAEDGDPSNDAAARVSRMLMKMAEARQLDSIAREASKVTGRKISRSEARQAVAAAKRDRPA